MGRGNLKGDDGGGPDHCSQDSAIWGAYAQMPRELVGELFRLGLQAGWVELEHQEAFLRKVHAWRRREEAEEDLASRIDLNQLSCSRQEVSAGQIPSQCGIWKGIYPTSRHRHTCGVQNFEKIRQ